MSLYYFKDIFEKMKTNFYYEFENTFRGTRKDIKKRLEVYLEFLEVFKEQVVFRNAIDLGCGRGEWLELLQENGFNAQGIELDEAMALDCRERGLRVSQGDLIQHLGQLPDNSFLIVSAFHVIEHIAISDIHILLQHALRVLVPGGLLILETPNTENLVVASCNFYIDPTHNKPIPSNLLTFLAEFNGFSRTKIMRLQENKNLFELNHSLTLWDVISGASPDYAIIAQKSGSDLLCQEIKSLFDKKYGFTLHNLANKYQFQIDQQFNQIDQQFNQINQQFKMIYSSVSWRITRPIRFIGKILCFLNILLNKCLSSIKSRAHCFFHHLLFKNFIKKNIPSNKLPPVTLSELTSDTTSELTPDNLSQREQKIFSELKTSIEKRGF